MLVEHVEGHGGSGYVQFVRGVRTVARPAFAEDRVRPTETWNLCPTGIAHHPRRADHICMIEL